MLIIRICDFHGGEYESHRPDYTALQAEDSHFRVTNCFVPTVSSDC